MLGFNHAFNGIKSLLSSERNFRIQLLIFVFVILAGIFLKINLYEWLALLSISALVLSLEAFNSCIEKLCDLYSTAQDSRIKWIKDVSAAAVLISSIISVLVGGFIFIPKLITLFS
jgi:diacylglycerol kinase